MVDLVVEIDRLRRENELLNEQLREERRQHEALVARLTTELTVLRRRVFGQKAERLHNAQAQQSFVVILRELGLIPADELAGDEPAKNVPPRKGADTPAPQPHHKPKKITPHGRRKCEDTKVAVERIVVEPVERSLPGGERLQKIGEEITSYLDHRPASVVRVEVIRPKYMRPEQVGTNSAAALAASPAEPADTETAEPAALVKVFVAPSPALPIAKGLAGAALLAHVLVMKYADHLPLHRQERMFRRDGVHLPRSTLCGFVQGAVALLRHIVEAMWRDAKTHSPLLMTDGCTVRIRAKNRCHKGTFQVVIAPQRHVCFAYLRHNNGAAMAALLAGFGGKLQCDAASVYHETFRLTPSIIEVGCWAHARRNVYETLVSARELALVGIGFIGALYDAHRKASDPVTGRVDGTKRRALAQPIVDRLAAWIARVRPKCTPGSPIETALGYMDRQWIALTRFLDDATLRLDNNLCEGELRYQKVGENNWLFCATDIGAECNAVVVSLVASCRMHGIEPYAYFRDVLSLLPTWPVTRVLELAPLHWKKTAQRPDVLEQLNRLQPLRCAPRHE